ncbi:MAG: hypothetical protein JSU63_03340 [Phycisphaerales bacterium]|nr:MAG: hypothetical protein JSU63_03340 [Phycisphaerales bacterium]
MANGSISIDCEEYEEKGSWWLRAEVVAFVVAVLCYVNVLPNDFCDDGKPIVQLNAKVNDPGQWGAVWLTDYWSETRDATPNRDLLYRPVSLSSYRLVGMLFDRRPFPQLAINVLLHAVICVLVARLCRLARGSNGAAMLAGGVFAVLPIHAEVIANVVGRADLLATVGILAAVLSHRRSMIATTERNIVTWRVAAGTAAFIAMGAKETGVAVVPMVVLLDKLWYQKWRAASRDREWWTVRSLARFAYLLIPLALYFALRFWALEGKFHQDPALTKTVNVLVDAPWWQHVLGVMQLWGMYWAKTLWPRILCINYSINEIRLATNVIDAHVILGTAVTAVLIVASVLTWHRKMRSVAFLSVSIAICYILVSNSVVLIQVFFAERNWYLPSVWVAILVGLAAAPATRYLVGCLLASVIMLGMAERCWVRNAEWESNTSLHAAAYRDHPRAVGVLRLYGQTLVNNYEFEEGIELLERAIEIDPGFTDAQRSLGQAYLRIGALESAVKHLQNANMQVPGHPPTVQALEYAAGELSTRYGKELTHLQHRAQENASDADAELAYVRALRTMGLTDRALARFRAAESRFAQSVDWQHEYAVTLVMLDQRDEAIDRYYTCLALDTADPGVLVELAMLLLERRKGKDLDEAWRLASRAGELAPDAPPVLVCQAELLALRGELEAAGKLYRRAIFALPVESAERKLFEQRAKALGQ